MQLLVFQQTQLLLAFDAAVSFPTNTAVGFPTF
jgi:hypothetical protein